MKFMLYVVGLDGQKTYDLDSEADGIRSFGAICRLDEVFLGGLTDMALTDADGVVLREWQGAYK